MDYQNTFKRYEIKYLITEKQKELILSAMNGYMMLDNYGKTTIRNIYLDTDNFRLIRRSIEKPVYKEKLRVRSYMTAKTDTPVFVELKKKYKSVVYKRRLVLPEGQVTEAFSENLPLPKNSQIAEEIEYFRQFYAPLYPKVFLSYEREAYYSLCGSDLRITLDNNIIYRKNELSLCSEPYGTPIVDKETFLMEIKTSGSIPLWLTNVLTENKIFKTSFSKYGKAYEDIIKRGELFYA